MKRVGIVVAVVAVLVTATLAGIWIGTRTPTSSTTPTPTTSRTGNTSEIAVGTVAAGEGGTLPGPGTLKLGYPHTREGAVAALTNYQLAAMDQSRVADPAYQTALAEAISLDDTAKADIAKGAALSARFCSLYTNCTSEPRRGAYAIRSYSDTQAEIAIWAPDIYTVPKDGSGKDSIVWGITTHLIFWNGSDWKLKTLGTDGTLEDATSPVLGPSDPKGNPTRAEKALLLTTPRDGSTKFWTLTWLEYSNAVH